MAEIIKHSETGAEDGKYNINRIRREWEGSYALAIFKGRVERLEKRIEDKGKWLCVVI